MPDVIDRKAAGGTGGLAMTWDKITKLLQLAAAVLAVPAGVAGAYSAWRSYFSADVACQTLRTSILATMEKNIPAEAKRSLLRKDVAEFEKSCGASDPDARAIFVAAMRDLQAPPAPATMVVPSAPAAEPANPPAAPPRRPLAAVAGILGGASAGRAGWVALGLRDGGAADLNFDGYAISARSLPPAGTVLMARWPVPMWAEPQSGSRPDLSAARGLVRAGMCVRIVSCRLGADRLWAEVVPSACS